MDSWRGLFGFARANDNMSPGAPAVAADAMAQLFKIHIFHELTRSS
jgi:hypothetical protein